MNRYTIKESPIPRTKILVFLLYNPAGLPTGVVSRNRNALDKVCEVLNRDLERTELESKGLDANIGKVVGS